MLISLIVAVADNDVIGKTGVHDLLWHQGTDQRRFRDLTLGHPMIMGRTTFETFKRPLPGRRHIVVTHDHDYRAESCEVVHSIDEALLAAEPADEVFVIGGATIYQQTLPIADKIYLTRVHAHPKGDAFFHYDPADWQEIANTSHLADDNNDYPYSFIDLIRRPG